MPWKQGQSGNPRGRPRKSQKTMAQLRSQISEHLPDVIEVLAGAAKEGDVQALCSIDAGTRPEYQRQRICEGVKRSRVD